MDLFGIVMGGLLQAPLVGLFVLDRERFLFFASLPARLADGMQPKSRAGETVYGIFVTAGLFLIAGLAFGGALEGGPVFGAVFGAGAALLGLVGALSTVLRRGRGGEAEGRPAFPWTPLVERVAARGRLLWGLAVAHSALGLLIFALAVR